MPDSTTTHAPIDATTDAMAALQQQSGATLTLVGDRWVPQSFPTDDRALESVSSDSGVVLYDRSHGCCLNFTGDDRLDFLHGQTTNDMKGLKPGRGCDTCVVTSTARTIELATALATERELLLFGSAQRRQTLQAWFGRLIRFSRAELSDISDSTAVFEAIGSESDRLIEAFGGGALIGQAYASHLELNLPASETRIRVVVGTSLALPGYSIVCDRAQAAEVWQALLDLKAIPMGETAWERLRVQRGRPVPDRELTEDFNPLEAGLWHAVSLDKGCYIGQETLARLHTYNGVKQELWGLKLSDSVEPGVLLEVDGQRAGAITSALPEMAFALAYVRRHFAQPGRRVNVGDSIEAELVELPYPQRSNK